MLDLFDNPPIQKLINEKYHQQRKQINKVDFEKEKKDKKRKIQSIVLSSDDENTPQTYDNDANKMTIQEENDEFRPTKITKNETMNVKKNIKYDHKDFRQIFANYVIFIVIDKIDKNFTTSNGKEEEIKSSLNMPIDKNNYANDYDRILNDYTELSISSLRDMMHRGDSSYIRFTKFVNHIIPSMIDFRIQEIELGRSHACYFSENTYKGNKNATQNTTSQMIVTYNNEAKENIMTLNQLNGTQTPTELNVFISNHWKALVTAFTVLQHSGNTIYGEVTPKIGIKNLEAKRVNFDTTLKLISFISKDIKDNGGIIANAITRIKLSMNVIFGDMTNTEKNNFKVKHTDIYERWLYDFCENK
jgi:hypothetical protein